MAWPFVVIGAGPRRLPMMRRTAAGGQRPSSAGRGTTHRPSRRAAKMVRHPSCFRRTPGTDMDNPFAPSMTLELLGTPAWHTADGRRDLLNRQDEAHAIVAEVGAPNLQVQMDLYHLQIVEGDVTMKLRQYLPTGRVGHLQIAGVPLRHEPDLGELNFPPLFDEIDRLGYDGWIGCEYRPKADTSAGLGWARAWLAR